MKKILQPLFDNEVLSYIFFGIATTVVSIITRLFFFFLLENALTATLIGNVTGILFAFITNDTIVFRQARHGWPLRLVKFFIARLGTLFLDMALTFIFVTTFPFIIGQFVGNNLTMVNTIETFLAQILIIVLNYVFSKLFVFRDKKTN